MRIAFSQALVLLQLLRSQSAEDFEVDGSKNEEDAEYADGGDGVAVEEGGDHDGHHLAQGADDDKHHGPKLGYGVENKQLKANVVPLRNKPNFVDNQY